MESRIDESCCHNKWEIVVVAAKFLRGFENIKWRPHGLHYCQCIQFVDAKVGPET